MKGICLVFGRNSLVIYIALLCALNIPVYYAFCIFTSVFTHNLTGGFIFLWLL